ncbi:MAG: hypothetical protein HND52_07190 [Ignavibacteriae bacterium]|nr:hypothetical protein [Ignavibacteriota bacterium]NOG97729.1 hypothetical protein [Ignavibacteriota bacterium]
MNNSITNILNSEKVKQFIKSNSHISVQKILLKYSGKTDLPIKEIAEQIECRIKARKKLPALSKHNLIYKKVSLEQASSELTADFKSSRINGKHIIDLTGGLGIDSIYFANVFDKVIYCELKKELCEIAEYNFNVLNINNIQIINGDGIEILKNYEDNFFDWIYADPSRRNQMKRSVDIKFYTPDVIKNFELLKSKTKNLMLKLAPAFDITEAFKLFPALNEFSVVSVNNECKEVLLFFNFEEKTKSLGKIKSAVMLHEREDAEYFSAGIDESREKQFADVSDKLYFYEPNAAIRKADLTKLIADKFKMKFVNPISDYLVSQKAINHFSGRKFKIEYTAIYNDKEIKKYLKEQNITKANIARSNFPLKPEEIKEQFKLKDGGQHFLFFTTNCNGEKIFIDCLKF